jgi:hypothetical protein
MYIFNGPSGYDELTGNIYINPESVDGFVVAQTEPGLSEDEAREAIGRVGCRLSWLEVFEEERNSSSSF